ncbi:MAG TPA: DnaJ domain-containing protein [Bryobacteraceae bacterium]|nr:DnaJ domain-containing protein [Bryobacteraceae bacterium]
MTEEAFVDHYETLQISPNADADTIHRVYRILAQRYHPDNRESGSSDVFREVTQAYKVLSEPEKRAAYDVQHRQARRLTWRIFDQANSAQGVNAEKRKREGVLSALYRKRVAQAEQPFLSLKELEDLLGVPREHLEFTLWYLKEGQYVLRSDNARYTVTMKGVDLAEALIAERSAGPPVAFLNQALQQA